MKIIKLLSSLALVAAVIATSSCGKLEDRINSLEQRISELEDTRIPSIDEQVASIKKTIEELEKTDAGLREYISALEDTDKTHSSEIGTLKESLQQKEQALGKRIDDLNAYVEEQLKANKDWVSSTFSTLEQYQMTCDDIVSLRQSIVNQNSELKKLISDTETSMKSWVNDLLTGYYTISEVNAKLEALQTAQVEGDKVLATDIEELETELVKTKSDIKTAYEKAISDAISTCEGQINTKIANDIKEANDILQGKIDALNTRIADIEARLKSVEDKLQFLEKQINEIAYISHIPTYSDSRSVMWYCKNASGKITGHRDTMRFELRPAGMVEKLLADDDIKFEIQTAYNTLVKSGGEIVDLPILEVFGKNDILTIIFSGEEIHDSFFNGVEGASCRLLIKAGEAEKISEYVQMRPAFSEHKAFFVQTSISLFVGGTHTPEIVKYPASAPVSFKSSNPDVITVTQDGTLTGVGVGDAILSVTTKLSGFTQSIPVNVSASSVATDLSKKGTANSYIVPYSGTFSFKADVKGNSKETIDGSPASAVVLWESFGTGVKPKVGDLISSAAYVNGNVVFRTPDIVHNGNALIAVKDAAGKILWSWHIWICKGYDPIGCEQVYNNNAGTMMDRNLGATSVTHGDAKALGLLYQWGRKDPFLSSSSITEAKEAESTAVWPSIVVSDSDKGTIPFTIEHPTTFLLNYDKKYDWYYTDNDNRADDRWSANKTIYDPCPYGWRVPDGGRDGIWSKAFGTSDEWNNSSSWDDKNKGMDFSLTDRKLGVDGPIWYPASVCRYSTGGIVLYPGITGYYWSIDTDGYNACGFYFGYGGYVAPSYPNERGGGYSVRCQKDE